MKLRDKYKALSDAEFVKQMMVASAYGSMQLEDQTVSRKKIEVLYEKVKQEKEELPSAGSSVPLEPKQM